MPRIVPHLVGFRHARHGSLRLSFKGRPGHCSNLAPQDHPAPFTLRPRGAAAVALALAEALTPWVVTEVVRGGA